MVELWKQRRQGQSDFLKQVDCQGNPETEKSEGMEGGGDGTPWEPEPLLRLPSESKVWEEPVLWRLDFTL